MTMTSRGQMDVPDWHPTLPAEISQLKRRLVANSVMREGPGVQSSSLLTQFGT